MNDMLFSFTIAINGNGIHDFIQWVLIILVWVMRQPNWAALPGPRGMLPARVWQEREAIG